MLQTTHSRKPCLRLAAVLALTALLLAASTLTRAAPPPPDLQAPHVAGELLLQWRGTAKAPSVPEELDTLLASLSATIVQTFPALRIARLRLPETRLAATLARLQADPRLAWAEPNYLLQLDFTPNDLYYATYQHNTLANMEMEAAWDLSRGDPAVLVAIIDTGMDLAHSDLASSVWINDDEVPANGLDDDANGYVDDVQGWDFFGKDNLPQDVHGHGTHVTGIVAARMDNGLGIAGMAGDATIMPLSIFSPQGFGTSADLIEAILYTTDNGAQVINRAFPK